MKPRKRVQPLNKYLFSQTKIYYMVDSFYMTYKNVKLRSAILDSRPPKVISIDVDSILWLEET